jgi:drug/metabolite transporter (DMT)-like permease|tara:strand:- start:3984 stop:4892 length:909 start_codon:yes stop_codon:yes gene_type:complete
VSRLIPFAWLLFIGISWGLTQPLIKIAVTGGYKPLGMIFWQMLISVAVLGVINMMRRRPLPFDWRVIGFYIAFALMGTVIPNAASYKAYTVLPSGIMSLLLSLIPMMAFPIALVLGLDRFSVKRTAGLSLGLLAILLIIGVPDALPNSAMLAFIPLGLLASLMYAFEGNFVARFGTGGAGPLQLLLGASIAGVAITGPIAWGTGQWINPIHVWNMADLALITSALIHTLVYTLYVMIVRSYGPIFSVQVSYIVTAAGLGWAMLILGERYSGPIWLALGIMFVGIYLVSPNMKSKNNGASELS